MTIRYRITRWDWIRGTWGMLGYSRMLCYCVALLAALRLYSSCPHLGSHNESVEFWVWYATCMSLVLGLFALCVMTFVALNVVLDNGKGVLGEHALALTEEGLEESTAYNRSLYTWEGVRGIKETRSFYFFLVIGNGAQVVPRKWPLLAGDLAAFVEEFRTRLKNASRAAPTDGLHARG